MAMRRWNSQLDIGHRSSESTRPSVIRGLSVHDSFDVLGDVS